VCSALLAVEAVRACRRYGPVAAQRAREQLARVSLMPIDDAVLEHAARLDPPALRSPDALHLATALRARDDIGAFVAYDERLADAARAHRLPVLTPV
jgi:uncharacterized protein